MERSTGAGPKGSAPVVVQDHERGANLMLMGGEKTAGVVEKGEIPAQQEERPGHGGGRPESAGDDAVDAVGAPIGEHAEAPGGDGEECVELADGHAVGDEERRSVWQRFREHRHHLRSEQHRAFQQAFHHPPRSRLVGRGAPDDVVCTRLGLEHRGMKLADGRAAGKRNIRGSVLQRPNP